MTGAPMGLGASFYFLSLTAYPTFAKVKTLSRRHREFPERRCVSVLL